ncbi:zinc finger protein ZPR1-like protein [Cucumis melo var. makuwa]|uniref:Zinc finger protein ZPR1-like protein n=1 Tax=Cucumis melo var. makuwa TaxID=1194695 RepID=A0A5D3BQN2_CUCMM|nr:zinc finger protein ZPR1-like protein [Cucumis melo var. makuwa]
MLELQSQPTLEGSQSLSRDEICNQVLGRPPGYSKGLGWGPKQKARKMTSASSSTTSCSQSATERCTTRLESSPDERPTSDTKTLGEGIPDAIASVGIRDVGEGITDTMKSVSIRDVGRGIPNAMLVMHGGFISQRVSFDVCLDAVKDVGKRYPDVFLGFFDVFVRRESPLSCSVTRTSLTHAMQSLGTNSTLAR